jgi:phage minor structural protein
MLSIYQDGQSDFTQPGIFLKSAFNVNIKQRINQPNALSFRFPYGDADLNLIKPEAAVKAENELFTVKIITDGIGGDGLPFISAECSSLWWEVCEKKHLPRVFHIGTPADSIIADVFSGISYKGNMIRPMTAGEAAALGFTLVTAPTDITVDKTNPIDVLGKIRAYVGGEIYIDGFRFALVTDLGRDTGNTFTMTENTKSVERTVDSTRMVTRLYPYGRNGLEITSETGKDYIDSPLIGSYPIVYEGYRDYNTERPEILLQYAEREFAGYNFDRLDVPKVSYKCSVIDLWKIAPALMGKIKTGDYVTVYDAQLGINIRTRVTEYDYFPYEPQSGTVTLGNPPQTLGEILGSVAGLKDLYDSEPAPDIVIREGDGFFNTLIEVARHETLAVQNIHLGTAWINDLMVERVYTNILPYVCYPNLVFKEVEPEDPAESGGDEVDENPDSANLVLDWEHDEPTYWCRMPGKFQHSIEMELIHQRFIENVLIPVDEAWNIPLDAVEPLIIDGKQYYYTSIKGGVQPYEFFTVTNPKSIHPDITDENAEMFMVYIRKIDKRLVKAAWEFHELVLSDGTKTVNPRIAIGAGTGEGDNGKWFIELSFDGPELLFVTRTGVRTKLHAKHDGKWYYNGVELNTGGESSGGSFIYPYPFPTMPTSQEFEAMEPKSLVVLYDSGNPIIFLREDA